MTHAQLAPADAVLNLRWQLQQTQEIRHGGAVFAHFLGDFLLREVTFVNQALVAFGQFNGVQILSVDVLDDGELQHLLIRLHIENVGGNGGKAEAARSPKAALTGNELVAAVVASNGDGLNDALLGYRLTQFFQSLRIKREARLKRVGVDEIDLDLRQGVGAVAVLRRDVGYQSS